MTDVIRGEAKSSKHLATRTSQATTEINILVEAAGYKKHPWGIPIRMARRTGAALSIMHQMCEAVSRKFSTKARTFWRVVVP